MIAAIHTKSGPPLRIGRKGNRSVGSLTGASGDGMVGQAISCYGEDYLSTMPTPIPAPEIVERVWRDGAAWALGLAR
jgi:hypothetical protein